MPPLARNPVFLEKVWLLPGSKLGWWQRGHFCLYCFGSGKGTVSISPWAVHTSDSWCLGSVPSWWSLGKSEARLQEMGWKVGRDMFGVEKAGQGCAINYQSPIDGEQSANLHVSLTNSGHRPLLSISSYSKYWPRIVPTIFFLSFFFLKCKKLSAALERGSLDRPFNAKSKGAAWWGLKKGNEEWETSCPPPSLHICAAHLARHTEAHAHTLPRLQAEGRFSIRTPLKRHQVSELLGYTQAWAQRAMINQSPEKPGLEAGGDSTSLLFPPPGETCCSFWGHKFWKSPA